MVIILQCAILFLFLAVGELLVWLTDIPVPSSIIGMIALTTALQCRIIKLHHVSGVADYLVKNLGFFFIPAGVGLIEYFELLRAEWLPIVGATAVSTIVVLAVTGQFHQISRKIISHHDQSDRK